MVKWEKKHLAKFTRSAALFFTFKYSSSCLPGSGIPKFIEGGVMFLQGSYWGNYTNFPYRVCPYSLVRYWILRRWPELLWADRFCPKCYTPRGQPFAPSSSLKGRQRDGLIRPLIVLFISHFNKRMLKLMFIFRWGRRPGALGPVLIICQEGILFPGTLF